MNTTLQTAVSPESTSPSHWPFTQWLPLFVVGWSVSAVIFIGLFTSGTRLLRYLVLDDDTIKIMDDPKPVWLGLEPILPGNKEAVWWKGGLIPSANRTHSDKQNDVNP